MNLKLLPILICSIITSVSAQRLPNIQKTSIWAPDNIKVDGKATEWDHFEAHNDATDMTYTMCNDAENLYLVVLVSGFNSMLKMTGGGITLWIQKSGKKDKKGAVSINYPVFDKKTTPHFGFTTPKGSIPPKELMEKFADSTMQANNLRLEKSAKYIRTSGSTTLDTLVSIYNDEGIKTFGYLDNKLIFTCELSVNLKHLGLSLTSNNKFTYHILFNDGPNRAKSMFPIPAGQEDNPLWASTIAAEQKLYATTDFWGEYTLATKK